MNKKLSKKPLAASIALLDPVSGADIPIGNTEFHILGQVDDRAWLSGIIKKEGKFVGRVDLNEVPIVALPASPSTGRPKETAKHLAVFLAWALEWKNFGKKGFADEAVAQRFKYSEPKKVRTIRIEHEKEYRVLDDCTHITLDAPCPDTATPSGFKERTGDSVFLFRSTTVYTEYDGRFEIVGVALAWSAECGESPVETEVKIAGVLEGDISGLKSSDGPKLFVLSQPGR